MGNSSSDSRRRISTTAPGHSAKAMRERQTELRRERVQILIVSLVTAVAVGLGFTLALTSDLSTAFRSLGLWQRDGSGSSSRGGDSLDKDGAAFGRQTRSGTIIPATPDPCRQLKFNNETGGVSETSKPCKPEIVLDAKGVQVPQGTHNRMDAISKAFSKDR